MSSNEIKKTPASPILTATGTSGKKSDNNKINENIKHLSNQIIFHSKRVTSNNSDNIHEIISKVFDKDAELMSLNNKNSVIHELDFLESPKKKLLVPKSPNKKRSQSMNSPLKKNSGIKQLGNNGEKLISSKQSFKQANSKKIEFSIFEKNSDELVHSDESLVELEKEYLEFGFSNIKKIRKKRIKSMENNPRKLKFYEKNLFHKQKRDLAVEMMRKKMNEESTINLQTKPSLSKKTKKIISNKLLEVKPLYQRIDEVMDEKNEYIHKLKKFHNEDSKVKWNDFSQAYDNNYLNELSNIENFDAPNVYKIPNTTGKQNFNTKFINYNKTPESGNNTFLKMLNDTNIEFNNLSSVNNINTPNKKMGFLDEENDKGNFNNNTYQNFLNSRKKPTSIEDKTKNQLPFDPNFEVYEKFEIKYPERTKLWLEKEKKFLENKNDRLMNLKKIIEQSKPKTSHEVKCEPFHPNIDKNSERIVNEKKLLSRSLAMSISRNGDYENYSNTARNPNYENSGEDVNQMNVFENLYSRRFDSEIKKQKILQEITYNFKPKINKDYKCSKNKDRSVYHEQVKKTKLMSIPIPKIPKQSSRSIMEYEKKNSIENEKNNTEKIKEKVNKEENFEQNNKKKREKNLMNMLEEVEMENMRNKINETTHKRRSSESNYLYKLNVRSSSAWDKNKENNVYFDQKFAKILSKVGMIKY